MKIFPNSTFIAATESCQSSLWQEEPTEDLSHM